MSALGCLHSHSDLLEINNKKKESFLFMLLVVSEECDLQYSPNVSIEYCLI